MNLLILTDPSIKKDYAKIFETVENLGHNLIGFLAVDNDLNFRTIEDYDLFPFACLPMLKYDFLLIDAYIDSAKSFIPALTTAGVPEQKIKTIYWLLQQKMTKIYEDVQDKAIQETLEWWKTNELSIFNQHLENYPNTYDEVYFDDSCGLPYIMFKTVEDKEKRMYFPPGSGLKVPGLDENKLYIKDVLREQVPTSPHLYVKGEHKINDGDVLIDAGVCEGNFSLKYVDVVSKIYLFEMNKNWCGPLYRTFKDYWDKVELIPRAVAKVSEGGKIAIDDAVSIPRGSNVFLKMDIEGAEVDALRGARKTLQSNNVRASVCSYHKRDDAWMIKSIFRKYGYRTGTSDGYMIFIEDPNILEYADFRKAIIYAENY